LSGSLQHFAKAADKFLSGAIVHGRYRTLRLLRNCFLVEAYCR
jgi:hypothetical protein